MERKKKTISPFCPEDEKEMLSQSIWIKTNDANASLAIGREKSETHCWRREDSKLLMHDLFPVPALPGDTLFGICKKYEGHTVWTVWENLLTRFRTFMDIARMKIKVRCRGAGIPCGLIRLSLGFAAIKFSETVDENLSVAVLASRLLTVLRFHPTRNCRNATYLHCRLTVLHGYDQHMSEVPYEVKRSAGFLTFPGFRPGSTSDCTLKSDRKLSWAGRTRVFESCGQSLRDLRSTSRQEREEEENKTDAGLIQYTWRWQRKDGRF